MLSSAATYFVHTMSRSAFCLVDSEIQAKVILGELLAFGLSPDDIAILAPDKSGSRDFGHERHSKAPEGAVVGATVSGLVGALAAWATSVGLIVLDALQLMAAAGPLAAGLAGFGGGAIAGAVCGALIGKTIPEFVARRYNGKIVGGNILIAVRFTGREERERIAAIFAHARAHDISARSDARVGAENKVRSAPDKSTEQRQLDWS